MLMCSISQFPKHSMTNPKYHNFYDFPYVREPCFCLLVEMVFQTREVHFLVWDHNEQCVLSEDASVQLISVNKKHDILVYNIEKKNFLYTHSICYKGCGEFILATNHTDLSKYIKSKGEMSGIGLIILDRKQILTNFVFRHTVHY